MLLMPERGKHAEPERPHARNAQAICSSCGRGFAGTKAFDAHRVGSYQVPADHPEGRRCLNPANDPRFESIRGIETITDPDTPREIEIWGLVDGRVRVRELYAENGAQAQNRKRKSAMKSGA
jgi:hypothetical protein